MATINATFPSILDHAKRMDPSGKLADIVEMLSALSPAVKDAHWQEGNLPTGHQTTQRSALPAPTWRLFNQGVAPQKSRSAQVVDTCGMMFDYSVVDEDVAMLNGNTAEFRLSEDSAFIEAFTKEAETGIFYHSTLATPQKFHGLAPRFNLTTALGGSQIVSCEASPSGSDQTSMWLVGWGPRATCLIYPKGSMLGLEHKDMGLRPWPDADGLMFNAFVTNWKWKMGLAVQDHRRVARVANIDTSSIDVTTMTLINATIGALHKVKKGGPVNYVWYANRTVTTILHKMVANNFKSNPVVMSSFDGQPVMTLHGIPVHETDAITNTEAVIS